MMRYYHPVASKEYVRRQLRDRGALAVFGFEASLEEALAMVDAEPGEYLGVGPCDDRIDGVCQGHDFTFAPAAQKTGQQELFGVDSRAGRR